MYQWAHTPEGEKTSIAMDFGSANIVTAIAFLKAQESSEKLAIQVAKSQSFLEYFTLLLFFLTMALVFSLIYTIGGAAAFVTILISGVPINGFDLHLEIPTKESMNGKTKHQILF